MEKLIILGILGLVLVSGCIEQSESVTQEEIDALQARIDLVIEETPWLENTNICEFKDTGKQIVLNCKKQGGFGSSSGSYYEDYRENGYESCKRIGGWGSIEYNCTFIEYPDVKPINKPSSLTIVKKDGKYIIVKLTESTTTTISEDFCGTSTKGPCSTDEDCITGGCSSQVCQSSSEEPAITTCDWRDCYNARAYGLGCRCIQGKCMWTDKYIKRH